MTNLVAPGGNVTAFAVEDQPPPGWLVTNISDGGTFDVTSSKIQWGPFFASSPQTLTYDVLPPISATGSATFSGAAVFDNINVPITGQRETTSATVFYGSIVCGMASNFSSGKALTVTNWVTPGSNITIFAVEDSPPAEWTVSQISDGGVFDSETHSVKWGPFFDTNSRALTYLVTPPDSASGTAVFDGKAIFDLVSVPISGQRQIEAVNEFPGNVVSALPAYFTAGIPFTVTDSATPPTNVAVYAVEDVVPTGWNATNISHGGVFDSLKSAVKWGPFFDNLPRSLSYDAISPGTFSSAAEFSGVASFGTNTVLIAGQRQSLPGTGTGVSIPVVLVNPTVDAAGRFQFDFTNSSGQVAVVVGSTNPALPLSSWTPLSPPALLSGNRYRFTDTNAVNHSQRYYRLRAP